MKTIENCSKKLKQKFETLSENLQDWKYNMIFNDIADDILEYGELKRQEGFATGYEIGEHNHKMQNKNSEKTCGAPF